jgi:glucose-6-phosphate dehydrogenase assembly protein OpcA
MALVLKVLGQSAPAATTATTLYTVPATTATVVSSITVCNRSATATAFRVAIRPAGAVLADQMYLYYDVPIGGNDTFIATVGLSLATTDVITVYNTLATLSFQAYGQEQPA